MPSAAIACPVCGGDAPLRFEKHHGYRVGLFYDIHHCTDCGVGFAAPLKSDEQVYDAIYSQVERVPGYERYARYAREVAGRTDPLGYLAEQEDAYWAVCQALSSHSRDASQVLEIGCGLGYLTYALVKAGYSAQGLDISREAIQKASARYGDHYICADLYAFAEDRAGSFDAVIFTEVIEHVPDAPRFIQAATTLLRPGGSLILTTPNKSAYPGDILWETEPPPVHLWWFSERSLEILADKVGCAIRFIDFSEFNRAQILRQGFFEQPYLQMRGFQPSRWPCLDQQGKVRQETGYIYPKPPAWRSTLQTLPVASQAVDMVRQLRWKQQALAARRRAPVTLAEFNAQPEPRRPCLCAVLQKPA